MFLEFCDSFDGELAHRGPPALFTIDAKGKLRLDAFRTRDQRRRVEGALTHELCHCLFRDHQTRYVQYVLVTSPQLCVDHPRADIVRYPDQASALAALRELGQPPVCERLPSP